jgi:hypothetical protein
MCDVHATLCTLVTKRNLEERSSMNILPYLINPSISAGVVAVLVSSAILVGVIRQRVAIRNALFLVGAKVLTRTGFFWTVNLIFMAVSVLHAGIFFGITGNRHDLPGMAGYLGFAVSFFLDLVTIILMQAMLEARYRGEVSRARQFLLFITICCATSTFANLAISLNDFNAQIFLPHAPTWIQLASPYVLASFPLFVIMMSLAAEMILHVRPLEKLEEEEYEADEKKRLRIMQIRNTYLQKQAEEELRALTIRAQMRANRQIQSGQPFGPFRWFWEKPPQIDAVIAGVSKQLQAIYEPQIVELQRRLEELQRQVNLGNERQHNTSWWWNNTDPMGGEGSLATEHAQEPSASEPVETGHERALERSQGSFKPSFYRGKTGGEALDRQKTGTMEFAPGLLDVLKQYPKVASAWVEKGVKSVTMEEIIQVTGHGKRRLSRVPFQRTSRNKDLILVTSVIEWLKTAPLPGGTDTFAVVQIQQMEKELVDSQTHEGIELNGLGESAV